ncbi:MAG: 3-isopropylmalate dehydratase [Candidatus Coatesbacteria bacterium]|nr:3-isopropylmalate dehydratase [Candidatus Coatesbacteria bacterium]
MTRVWTYGDDVNTDQMFPGKYTYTCSTPEEIAPHLFEDLDATFAAEASAGDVILAGEYFGCGSSREHPAKGLRHVGVRAVIAKSFARIFFRSAINQGLLVIECPAAVEAYSTGDEVTVDEENGVVKVGGEEFAFAAYPPKVRAILEAGGLVPYLQSQK